MPKIDPFLRHVTPENVRQAVKRLDTNHIPYELLTFEDEGARHQVTGRPGAIVRAPGNVLR